jgi:hypothetical protein
MIENTQIERKRCKFCGHLLDAPSDNRDMSQAPVEHGKNIVQVLLKEGHTFGDICNFCYAHVSLFRHELPETYDRLLLEATHK